MASPVVANHHASYPGFAGPSGLLAALSMVWGRRADARLAAERTGLGPDDDVVDVGCGPGAAARQAAGIARSVTGVDPAAVMLRVARAFAVPGGGRRRVRYAEGSAERLPLGDASASVLWALATVHHWDDVDGGVAEAFRVLRPGGRLLAMERLVTPGARGLRTHGWTPAQAEIFAAACAEHGFVDVAASQHDVGRKRVLTVLGRVGTSD